MKVGEGNEVKILRVDTDDRKIGLSRKRVEWAEDDERHQLAAEEDAAAEAELERKRLAEKDLKGGLGSAGPLIAPIEDASGEED